MNLTPDSVHLHNPTPRVKRWCAHRSLILLSAAAISACGSGASRSSTATTTNPEIGTAEFGMTDAQLATAIDDVEAAIAACMSTAGFEYIPADVATVRAAMAAVGAAPGLTDADYIDQYGYGISTQFDNPAADLGLGPRNLAIIAGLSTAQQSAYRFILLGEQQSATFAVSLDNEDFSQIGGCTGAAVASTFDTTELSPSYVNPKDALVEQDPRVVAATHAWSECMRTNGYEYARPSDAEADISDRLHRLLGTQSPLELDASHQALLTELQGEEKAIARADYDCAIELLDPVIAQVETEVFGEPQG
jgi:hypothetical protein